MILLLRHGRTEANAGGLLLGRADPELDHRGEEQAAALAAVVGAATAGRAAQVISSPLRRARQTADAVAAVLGTGVTVDERWIELDYGVLDGTPVGQVPAELWSRWAADPAWEPEGGESLATLGRRVRAACDDLAAGPASSGDVVVVSHVSPIKAAVAWALGVGDEVAWRLYVAPGSLTRIAVSGPRRALHSFNETGHLAAGPVP